MSEVTLTKKQAKAAARIYAYSTLLYKPFPGEAPLDDKSFEYIEEESDKILNIISKTCEPQGSIYGIIEFVKDNF